MIISAEIVITPTPGKKANMSNLWETSRCSEIIFHKTQVFAILNLKCDKEKKKSLVLTLMVRLKNRSSSKSIADQKIKLPNSITITTFDNYC